eukprot:2803104-Rhodomonas_salina.1
MPSESTPVADTARQYRGSRRRLVADTGLYLADTVADPLAQPVGAYPTPLVLPYNSLVPDIPYGARRQLADCT